MLFFLRGVASAWAHPGVGSLAEVALRAWCGVLEVNGGFGCWGCWRVWCARSGLGLCWCRTVGVAAVVGCQVGVGFAVYDAANCGAAAGVLLRCRWGMPVSHDPPLRFSAWGGLFLTYSCFRVAVGGVGGRCWVLVCQRCLRVDGCCHVLLPRRCSLSLFRTGSQWGRGHRPGS